MRDYNYNENKQRGTADFPIDYHYVDSLHPQYEMPLHWHVEYEMIRILEGSFRIFLDGQEYMIEKGDLCFVADGVLHGGTPKNCIYECIVFDSNMIRSRTFASDRFLWSLVHHKITANRLYQNPDPALTQITDQLFAALREKKEGHELMVLSLLMMFFAFIQTHGLYSQDVNPDSREHKRTLQLKQVLDMIETSYTNPLSLLELSRAAGMSPKYFCRFFKEMTHRTPVDYLNHYRIELACHQLTLAHQSITEVAYSCGFNDFSYFIKTFKKHKGITPKKYSLAEMGK